MGFTCVVVTGFGPKFFKANSQGDSGLATGFIPSDFEHLPNKARSIF